MKIQAIKTKSIEPHQGDIFTILDQYLTSIERGSILAVTSKIVSICEGRVARPEDKNKSELRKEEADLYLSENQDDEFLLTIKRGILIPNAGIDQSNGNGLYILWPEDPQKSANQIFDYLVQRFGQKEIGVIITDSRTTPLRWGTTGIAIAHSGFLALKNYIGEKDIFGASMRVTQANLVDALAATAVLVMGEGSEQTPLCTIEDLPFIEFQNRHPNEEELQKLQINIEDDLYRELLQGVKWKKGIVGS